MNFWKIINPVNTNDVIPVTGDFVRVYQRTVLLANESKTPLLLVSFEDEHFTKVLSSKLIQPKLYLNTHEIENSSLAYLENAMVDDIHPMLISDVIQKLIPFFIKVQENPLIAETIQNFNYYTNFIPSYQKMFICGTDMECVVFKTKNRHVNIIGELDFVIGINDRDVVFAYKPFNKNFTKNDLSYIGEGYQALLFQSLSLDHVSGNLSVAKKRDIFIYFLRELESWFCNFNIIEPCTPYQK